MAENDDPTTGPDEGVPAPAEATVEQTAVTSEAVPAAPPKPKFTDRVWNFRAMAAVALAALLLGGGVGAAITAVSHDDGPDRRPGMMRFGDRPGPFLGPDGPRFGPGDRQQFRKDMRQWMKEHRGNGKSAPTPAPPTPTPTKNS